MKIFLPICLFLLVGCYSSNDNSINSPLESDPTIQAIFNETEIRDLTIILDAFTNQICEIEKKDNIEECYRSFLYRMHEGAKKGTFGEIIPFDEQEKMHEKISATTFNLTWVYNEHKNSQTQVTKVLNYKKESKYLEYLNLCGEKNKYIKNYHFSFINSGTITASMQYQLSTANKQIKANDIGVKLWIAIHYLTLNHETTTIQDE